MKLRKQNDKRYRIDPSRKVFAYRNLHKDCWSVRQDGLVKAHCHELTLWSCAFQVNRKGRERVLREKKKNLHAGVLGYISESTWDSYPEELLHEVTYNPYKHESFVMKDTGKSRYWANQVRFRSNKVLTTPL